MPVRPLPADPAPPAGAPTPEGDGALAVGPYDGPDPPRARTPPLHAGPHPATPHPPDEPPAPPDETLGPEGPAADPVGMPRPPGPELDARLPGDGRPAARRSSASDDDAARPDGRPTVGPGGGTTSAAIHAEAGPGPVRANPTARPNRSTPAESERAILADLARWRKKRALAAVPAVDPGTAIAQQAGFEVMETGPPPSLLRRYFTTLRHAVGLVYGAAVAVARDREQFAWVKGVPLVLIKLAAFFVYPFVRRDLRVLPLEVQLRRRLELLGPTYIKLGQVLALREDLLPPFITGELKNLLDRLPVMPFPEYLERVAKGLGRPVAEMFEWVNPKPLGSASIGQIHQARTVAGEEVILKVVKPHVYVVLKRDSRLLGFFGSFLQIFFSRYQPKKILDEFAEYTLREVDLRREADNAEQFALNFADEPDIRFPKIHREYSSRLVMTMEQFRGIRPDTPASRALPEAVRERIVDLGAKSIIQMLYADGFFHADLHAGNLFVLDTEPDEAGDIRPRIGFIDLGMVGYFDGDLRRTLLYYYFSLVTGDAENAARYLTGVAQASPRADARGFQRAVAELCRRFYRAQRYGEVSVAQLILESVSLAGQYRMYFPVELVLMTKALVTFEGVGQALMPGFDVAKVSQKHVNKLFLSQFNPVALVKESFRGAPELVDLIVKSPTLVAEAVRFLESRMRGPAPSPLAGVRTALLAGACLVSGALAVTLDLLSPGPAIWFVWVPLFILAGVLALRKG